MQQEFTYYVKGRINYADGTFRIHGFRVVAANIKEAGETFLECYPHAKLLKTKVISRKVN